MIYPTPNLADTIDQNMILGDLIFVRVDEVVVTIRWVVDMEFGFIAETNALCNIKVLFPEMFAWIQLFWVYRLSEVLAHAKFEAEDE